LKINISIETDYNVNDSVYVLTQIPEYRGSDNWIWALETDDMDRRKFEPFEIKGRVIKQYGKLPKVLYEIYNYLYEETEIFKDIDSALAECKKRNES